MPIFVVEKVPEEDPAFRVLGPDGKPVAHIQEFLIYLATCGRSAYTMSSYATGLAHFFGWLQECGKHVDEVTRHLVGASTSEPSAEARSFGPECDSFRRPVPSSLNGRMWSGAQRRPRTINHRLSVLASFFAFCIQRDEDRWQWTVASTGQPCFHRFRQRRRHGRRSGRPCSRACPQSFGDACHEKFTGHSIRPWRKRLLAQRFPIVTSPFLHCSSVQVNASATGMMSPESMASSAWNSSDIDERRRTITVRLKAESG